MATLTVNGHELKVIGREGWGRLLHEAGRWLPAYIEALVNTSSVSESVLNQTSATVRLTMPNSTVEGHDMVQVGQLHTHGHETFVRFEGQEVAQLA